MSGNFAPPPGPQGPSDRQAPRVAPAAPADARAAEPARSMLRSGRGVALAAWVAIGAGVALLIGISWSAALAWSDRGVAAAELGETGDLHPLQVVPGMCLEDLADDGVVGAATVVPCDQPHRAEVFTSTVFALAKYPGDDALTAEALEVCRDRIEGLLPEGSTWVAWAPSESSWARGDRVALCIAVFDSPRDEPLSPAGINATKDDAQSGDGQSA
ncbi:MAG: septum formation family protein [Demequina sp.]